jgi:hypothetical protein
MIAEGLAIYLASQPLTMVEEVRRRYRYHYRVHRPLHRGGRGLSASDSPRQVQSIVVVQDGYWIPNDTPFELRWRIHIEP